jgi:hypothetical protein
MIVLFEETSRNKDSNHNSKDDIINVTKAVAKKSTLMQTTRVRVVSGYL